MVWGLAAPFGTTCALDGEVRVTLGLQPQAHIWGTKWPPEADRMADDPHLSQEVHRGLKKHAARATGSEVPIRVSQAQEIGRRGCPSIVDNPDFRSEPGGNTIGQTHSSHFLITADVRQ